MLIKIKLKMINQLKKMAVQVQDHVYLFDFDEKYKSMRCDLDTDWYLKVDITMSSYIVMLYKKEEKIKEGHITFLVDTHEAAMYLNGHAKFTKGHLESAKDLGAVIQHLSDIYEHEKKVQILPS
mgnify:CR=1 FL=1